MHWSDEGAGDDVVGSGDGDGVVPGPRSARTPGPQPEPRAPELSALLADIDALRLVLSADLRLAASAVEAGALDIAADMVAGGQEDLRSFSWRAAHLLEPERVTEPAGPPALHLVPDAPAQDDDAEDEQPAAERSRGRRLLPAAPALAAAAALVGVLLGVTPSTPPSSPRTTPTAAAEATYAELYRLVELGAPVPALRAAALELHEKVEVLVEAAPQDPAAAAEALRLLELQVAVLDGSEHRGELLDALAETQRLVAQLLAAVDALDPQPAPAPAMPALPLPPAPQPDLPGLERPAPRRTAVTVEQQPAPAPAPQTAAPAEPAPASPPPPAPSSAPPADEPSTAPSPTRSPVFPGSSSPLTFREL